MGRNNIVGAWGEAVAAEYIRKKRYKVIATGYRCRYGEIDLIAQNNQYLLFIEVKLRRSNRFAEAKEFVDSHKQERLRTTASVYLDQFPTDLQPRFDVIEIYAPEGTLTKHPHIIHLEDAF
jgi:putative endonuclease